MSRNRMVVITAAAMLLAAPVAVAGPITTTSQTRQLLGDANSHGQVDSTQDIQELNAPDFNRYAQSLTTLADVGDAVTAVDAWQDSVIGTSALIATGSFHSEASIDEGATFAYGVGGSTYLIDFQLTESTAYVIRGVMSAGEGVHTRVALSRSTGEEIHNVLVQGDSQNVDLEGVLQPGMYELSISAFGTAFTNNGSTYDFEAAHYSVQFRTGGPEQDITGDGVVDVSDLFQLLEGWGTCPDTDGYCLGDINRDHAVDVSDLFQMLGAWGQ